jgi:hypothetical protein
LLKRRLEIPTPASAVPNNINEAGSGTELPDPQIATFEIAPPLFNQNPDPLICSFPFQLPKLNKYCAGLWLPSFTTKMQVGQLAKAPLT